MSDQGSIFDQPALPDPEEGERRKQEGIDRAKAGAGPDWNDRAYDALLEIAGQGEPFTSEDVRELLIDLGDWPPPKSPTVMGAVIQRAARAGVIAPTGDWTTSVFASSHKMPKRFWKASLS